MTTLKATRSRVAMNSTLSDLSFLAIQLLPVAGAVPALPKAPAQFARHTSRVGVTIAVSGQQSSVGLRPRHQLPRPGQPGFPAVSPQPREPTDDCSPLTALQPPP